MYADPRHLLAGDRRFQCADPRPPGRRVFPSIFLYFNELVYYFEIPVSEFFVKRHALRIETQQHEFFVRQLALLEFQLFEFFVEMTDP